MTLNKLTLALSLALFALPLSAMAQDTTTTTDQSTDQSADQTADQNTQDASAETPAADAPAEEESESNLTWNLAVTSDYVFRGISQTDRDPALQGGFDYAFGDSGFYVGTWGSNVDFQDRDGPDVEVDFYGGWNHDFNDDWNGDISLVRYTYYGARDVYGDIDYNEVIGKLAWKEMLTFTVGYANDYSNLDFSSFYTNLSGSWDLGNGFSFGAGFGHTDFSDDNGSYNDWTIGISKTFGPVECSLDYFDTDVDGPRLSDSLVLTFKIGG